MTKRYEVASTFVDNVIAQIREEFYNVLQGVTIDALFVFDDKKSEPVLKHRGYPAAATVRIVSSRDRAAGMSDAQIVIDRATWQSLSGASQRAVIDHELYHLEPVFDADGTVARADDGKAARCRERSAVLRFWSCAGGRMTVTAFGYWSACCRWWPLGPAEQHARRCPFSRAGATA